LNRIKNTISKYFFDSTNQNTAGTAEIQACGVTSVGVRIPLDFLTRHIIVKQEAQSSLAIG